MTTVRTLALAFLLLCSTAGSSSGSKGHSTTARASKAFVSAQVRSAARKLANAWVETAGPSTLDQLAQRSIAFSGMVPGTFVVLDGKRFSATQALTDSALTILGNKPFDADAAAIRNTVYTLMQIAEGRTTR